MNIAIMMMRSIVAAVFLGVSSVNAHSWVECTNYDPPSFEYDLLGYYDRSRCSGYPRAFARQYAAGFSVDTGYNWEHNTCRDSYNPTDYTTDIPMATYSAGQVIYISHPAKNHVADTCTNAFIPDNGVIVKMSSGVEVDTFDVSIPMLGDAHVNGEIDHLGFQRCFNFCENTGGSHCVMGWTLPTNITDGIHSFIWTWEFNTGQFYTNCFDAMITSGSSTPVPVSTPVSTPASTTPSATPDATSASSSYSSSGSGSSINDTVIVPTASSTTPTPSSTENFTIQTIAPSSTASTATSTSATPSPTTISPTITPTSTTSTPAEVISSSASSLSSPLVNITNYLIKFVGNVSIEGVINITEIANALRRL
jgi:hypothetical protein